MNEKRVTLCKRYSLENIHRLFGQFQGHEEIPSITIDFKSLDFISPLASVAILAALQLRVTTGLDTSIEGHNCCGASAYLHQIDFFARIEKISSPDDDNAPAPKAASETFVAVERIGGGTDTSKVSTRVAECVFPEQSQFDLPPEETSHFDFVQYAVSELINNVMQHSQSAGYLTAQYFSRSGCVEVAIADAGIGVRGSFGRHGTPGFRQEMSDAEVLDLALKSQVSSKKHLSIAWGSEPVNAGVGLTILREISRQTGGEFDVFSHGGHISVAEAETLADNMRYHGTACHIKIQRSNFKDFTQELSKAKTAAGLFSSPELGNFQ